MARITRRLLAREVVRMLKERPEARSKIMQSLAGYLIDTRQSGAAHLLINDIAQALQQSEGHVYAEVISASKLAPETSQNIVKTLSVMGAKNVEIDEKVNPEILGGLLLKIPGFQLDSTIKTKLAMLTGGN